MARSKKYATYDIESHNWTEFVLAGSYDGEQYLTHNSPAKLLAWLTSPEMKGYRVYAHNGGKFDVRFFINELVKTDLVFEIVQNGGCIIMIMIKLPTGGSVEICDSYLLLQSSLSKVTKAFNVKHSKGFIDFEKGEKFDINNQEHLDYLKNDCIGLYEALTKFQQWGLNSGINLGITLPSMAMNIFRKKFYGGELLQTNKSCEEFIRAGYYGGRTEIFRMYGEDLNYYDFVSLYPSVMIQKMPIGKAMLTKKFHKDKIGFYYGLVDVPLDLKIPPIATIVDKKLIFPVGKFNAYFTSDDIKVMDDFNIKYKIKFGYVFEDKAFLFKDYVNQLIKIKSESKKDSADYLLSKLYMNSLYGKFAMHREKEKIVREYDIEKIIDKKLRVFDEYNSLYIKDTYSRSKTILPHISAYITSLARNKLYRAMAKIGFNDIYYCDTDSIVTKKVMESDMQLGGLEKEIANIKSGIFLQPKAYALKLKNGNEITKLKGFNNKEGIDYSLYEKALLNNDITLIKNENERFRGFNEQKRKYDNKEKTGAEYNSKRYKFERIKQLKSLRNDYNKREIVDKYDTIPHILEM